MNDTIWIGILIVMGLIVGFTTSRSSHHRDAVLGGMLSRTGHYLAAGLLAMIAPTVLCNLFFIHPDFLGQITLGSWDLTALFHAIIIAIGMILLALVALAIYAIGEKPERDAQRKREQQGWTREDAEASGL